MRKIAYLLSIVLSTILSFHSQINAQKIVDYVVKTNGDTIHLNISKINFEQNIMRLYDSTMYYQYEYPLDKVSSFFYENAKWVLAETMQNTQMYKQNTSAPLFSIQMFNNIFSKRNQTDSNSIKYIFLPDIKKDKKYNIGVWGKVFGTKTEFHVNVKSDGKTTLYQYDYLYNTGAVMGTNSMLFIKNDSLGICHLFFADRKSSPELKAAIKEVLTAYTQDRPDMILELNEKFKYNYSSIKRYLLHYLNK